VSATKASADFVLVVSGMAREAAIAAGPGVSAIAGGGERLIRMIEAGIAGGAAGVLSFGIAGGLDPTLRSGSTVLATALVAGQDRWPADPAWQQGLAVRLPDAIMGPLAGVDAPVLTIAAKSTLRAATGALAVDMESHIAARLAAAHGLPFAALRIVCDPADRAIPAAALAGLGDDGATDVAAVLRALLRDPRQLPALLRLAADARVAFISLGRCRKACGPDLAFVKFVGTHAEYDRIAPESE
jgi:hopanoid-associated phosphorylase